jgi:predicted RNA-binding protein with EMAP domain
MDLEKQHPDDHEAKMARADCYKLAQYSAKLFKMINEGEELDGWVQAKITKAADYISSVYHYLEYEKMAAEQINQGPRDFEESVEKQVKNSLSEQWLQKKNQGR